MKCTTSSRTPRGLSCSVAVTISSSTWCSSTNSRHTPSEPGALLSASSALRSEMSCWSGDEICFVLTGLRPPVELNATCSERGR